MDAVSFAVAAAFGVVGSLVGQWIIGIFDTEPEQQRPMPPGPPPALRGKRPTTSDMLAYLEQTIDTTGYESKCVQMEGLACAVISITYRDGEPRTFRLVSRDSFATLDNVTIYEMATPEVTP